MWRSAKQKDAQHLVLKNDAQFLNPKATLLWICVYVCFRDTFCYLDYVTYKYKINKQLVFFIFLNF